MKIFDFFSASLKTKRGNTERRYGRAIGTLCDFLGVSAGFPRAEGELRRLKPTKVLKFLAWMRAEGYADATIRNTLAALKGLWREAALAEVVSSNPFAAVRHSVSRNRIRRVRPTKLVPFSKIEEILRAVDRSSFNGVVNFATLALLFGGGLRRSEVLGLTLGDIGVTPAGEMFLRIRDAKTAGERLVSLPPWAWEAYSELVQRRRKDQDCQKNAESAPVFVSYRRDGSVRGKLSEATLYRRFRDTLAAAGLPGYAPHSARATFATRLLAQGFDPITVSRALGHATPDQVIAYDKRYSGPDSQPQKGLIYK